MDMLGDNGAQMRHSAVPRDAVQRDKCCTALSNCLELLLRGE